MQGPGPAVGYGSSYGVGVDIVYLSSRQVLPRRGQLISGGGHAHFKNPDRHLLASQGSQDPYLPWLEQCAWIEKSLTEGDVASRRLDVLTGIDRAAHQHFLFLGLGVLDHDHGIGSGRDHGAGGDLRCFSGGDADLGQPAHGHPTDQAEGDRPVLPGFYGVFGQDGKAVHGGAGEAGNIDGGDDLLCENAAGSPAEGDAGYGSGGEVLQDYGSGFIEVDEAVELLGHDRGMGGGL